MRRELQSVNGEKAAYHPTVIFGAAFLVLCNESGFGDAWWQRLRKVYVAVDVQKRLCLQGIRPHLCKRPVAREAVETVEVHHNFCVRQLQGVDKGFRALAVGVERNFAELLFKAHAAQRPRHEVVFGVVPPERRFRELAPATPQCLYNVHAVIIFFMS